MKKLFILPLFVLFVACGGQKDTPEETSTKLTQAEEQDLLDKAKQIFGILPDKMPGSEKDTPDMIDLGKKLFFETKLSQNETQSCNTCHDLDVRKSGDDGKPTSPGAVHGEVGTRNSPTVLNAGYQFVQFWDGRAVDLVEQAKGPILNPVEMALKDEKMCVETINKIPDYMPLFKKAFPNDKNPINFQNIAVAIAAFERTLISKGDYDAYMAGNPLAMSNDAKKGMKLFIETGCITCHTGPLFGGNLYQKMGLMHPYNDTKDMGRYDVTKNEADKYIFKVPQLRNVVLTAPYFHDGKVNDLGAAIDTMAWINLNKKITKEDNELIQKFLNALTDTKLVKK